MDRMADTRICVMCQARPVDPRWRPFCSERCQLIDLGRWADGSYRVAAEPPSDGEVEEDDSKSEI